MSAPRRDVVVDAMRAFAVVVVVCFHGALLQGHLRGDGWLDLSVLSPGPWGWLVSWFVMVMPLFFVCGGYSHSLSMERRRAAGDSTGYVLAKRGRRLLVPLSLFVGCGALVATVLHVQPDSRLAIMVGTQLSRLLWFMAVYLFVVILAPTFVALQHRYGMLVPLAMLAGSLALTLLTPALMGALGRYGVDPRMSQVLLVWPLCHQLGIAYQQGFLRGSRRAAAAAVVVGVAAVAVGVWAHVFPPAAVGFGDAEGNITPPTLAMAAVALAQTGLLSLLSGWGERWRPGPVLTTVVTFLNLLAMTIYLWQVPAIGVAVVVGWALARAGLGWALSPVMVIPVTWVLLVLVAPWIARLENRLTPQLEQVDDRLVLAGSVAAFVGTWIVWRHGLLLSLAHPLALVGVSLVLAGTGLLTAGCRQPRARRLRWH